MSYNRWFVGCVNVIQSGDFFIRFKDGEFEDPSLKGLRLTRSGNLVLYGALTPNRTSLNSDNRLKHNEKNLSNGIDTIKQLKPYTYFKTKKLYDENHNFKLDASNNPITTEDYITETGFIAQDIMKINTLKHLVYNNSYTDNITKERVEMPYSLDYNGIFVYAVKAIQELCEEVEGLKERIAVLENK